MISVLTCSNHKEVKHTSCDHFMSNRGVKLEKRMNTLSKKVLIVTSILVSICIATIILLQPGFKDSNSSSGSGDFQTIYDSTVDETNRSRPNTNDFDPAQHYAWTVKETEFVPEYQTNVVTYKHIKTGGELVSFHWDKSENTNPREQEKVFSIFFRTPVSDSTGVPHILEHSVLCGSRKFTTKEPFAGVFLIKNELHSF